MFGSVRLVTVCWVLLNFQAQGMQMSLGSCLRLMDLEIILLTQLRGSISVVHFPMSLDIALAFCTFGVMKMVVRIQIFVSQVAHAFFLHHLLGLRVIKLLVILQTRLLQPLVAVLVYERMHAQELVPALTIRITWTIPMMHAI